MAIAPAIVAAIISGVTSLASTKMAADASAEKANTARTDSNNEMSAQRAQLQNWYNIRSNEDFTRRADQQNNFAKWRELINERYKQSRATNVVAGGSEASLAAEKESLNRAMGDAIAQSAGDAAARQDNLDRTYLGIDNQMSQNQANAAYQHGMYQAQQIAQAGSQAQGAITQMGGALIEALANKEWASKKSQDGQVTT